MAGPISRAGRWLLFRFDPETAHKMAIRALALDVHPSAPRPDPTLRRQLLGLDFPSPVGLGAGFDKNGVAIGGLLRLGFGFVEVGTVTPRPQPGNPAPRLFRLEGDRAIINRMGFNNDGAEAMRQRLAERAGRHGIVGVNLGANKDSTDRVADYVRGVTAFGPLASYLTINVSSPNTPGLRDLQETSALRELLSRAIAARDALGGKPTPVLLKLAPDLAEGDLAGIAETALGAGVDGMIVANTTTLARDGLKADPNIAQAGGLSGAPLFRRSTAMLAKLRKLVGPTVPLIGVGGIESGATAWDKLAAGADLIQVYTGMIYEGQGLAADLNRDLAARTKAAGMKSIADVVGTATERWAAESMA